MVRLNQTGGRLVRLAALASQLLNVVIFNGSPDETVSGRAYRQGGLQGDARWDNLRKLINKAFFWQPDHCRKSHQQDVRMAKALVELYGGFL